MLTLCTQLGKFNSKTFKMLIEFNTLEKKKAGEADRQGASKIISPGLTMPSCSRATCSM